MRQDKTFARIFLIFSFANVALAAPAVARQRHVYVAEAASEKRAQGPAIGSTDASGTGSSRMPPFEHYADMWGWANSDHLAHDGQESAPEPPSAVAITTQAPPPAANRITTHVPLSPETSFHSSVNWPDPGPSLPPHLLATPDSGSIFGKLGYRGMIYILGAGVVFGFGLHKVIKHLYVSPLSPSSHALIENRITNILTYDLPQ